MSHLNTNGGTPAQNCGCGCQISCEVGNCAYNKDKKYCTASAIKVGPQFASTTAETNCATFKLK